MKKRKTKTQRLAYNQYMRERSRWLKSGSKLSLKRYRERLHSELNDFRIIKRAMKPNEAMIAEAHTDNELISALESLIERIKARDKSSNELLSYLKRIS